MGITINPDRCNHCNTATYADVQVITNDNKIVGYQFIARVKCRDCGLPFHFPNLLEIGEDHIVHRASVRDYATELVVPLRVGPLDPFKN